MVQNGLNDGEGASPPRTAGQPWTVRELLGWTVEQFGARGLDTPRLDAEVLLAHAMECARMDLYVRHDDVVEQEARARFRGMVRRRFEREPVAYIEGVKGFHGLGLDLHVDRRVLIPRPETELLVDWVLEDLRPPPTPQLHVLDVGTGSGAIALALAAARADVAVTAVDVSPEALEVARANAARLELTVEFVDSDLLRDVAPPSGGWHAIVANLPYIPSAELAGLQPEVTGFEPHLALDGGTDGLHLVQALLQQCQSPGVLASRGALYLEFGQGQAPAVEQACRAAGLADVESRRDLAGIVRMIRARRPLA